MPGTSPTTNGDDHVIETLEWWPRPNSDAYRVTYRHSDILRTRICWAREIHSTDAVSRSAFLMAPASYLAATAQVKLSIRQ
ncbi:MAG TPA: hypothetical protein VGE21_00915 [Flavobacteriales bacterium]